ncbi:hypothetical protein ACQP2F_11670 [Actinoplanes sp. CA-030573]|uniref:hypothetical protein n=1 Tax=Actinoplanes sp. CA-030573 TaxID=3239898 RepID=UPI003D8E76D1
MARRAPGMAAAASASRPGGMQLAGPPESISVGWVTAASRSHQPGSGRDSWRSSEPSARR